MEQMRIDPSSIVDVELSGVAGLLKPVVFKEGGMFCCLLGHDPQTGVMGCGATPELAVSDWDEQLRVHLAEHDDDDYIVQYVNTHIPVKEQSAELKAYLKQAIRPPQRK